MAEARSESALCNTLKKERNLLRQLDYQENYQSEVLDRKVAKNERIALKHESIRNSVTDLMARRTTQVQQAYQEDMSLQRYLLTSKAIG